MVLNWMVGKLESTILLRRGLTLQLLECTWESQLGEKIEIVGVEAVEDLEDEVEVLGKIAVMVEEGIGMKTGGGMIVIAEIGMVVVTGTEVIGMEKTGTVGIGMEEIAMVVSEGVVVIDMEVIVMVRIAMAGVIGDQGLPVLTTESRDQEENIDHEVEAMKGQDIELAIKRTCNQSEITSIFITCK